jgi:hypothetical protein
MSAGTITLVLAGYAVLCWFGYCLIVSRLPARQLVPGQIQLLAWLGILAAGGAACFAVAFFLKGD